MNMRKYSNISILVVMALFWQSLLGGEGALHTLHITNYPFHTGFGMGTNALRPRAMGESRSTIEQEAAKVHFIAYSDVSEEIIPYEAGAAMLALVLKRNSNVPIKLPPGILALMGSMKAKGITEFDFTHMSDKVILYNYFDTEPSYQAAVNRIKETGTNVIGIGVTAFDMTIAKALIQRLRKDLPHCFIVVGGAGPTAASKDRAELKKLMKDVKPDIILVGEAEETFPELLFALGKYRADRPLPYAVLKKLRRIKGLYYRSRTGKRVINNVFKKTERIIDLSRYPLAVEELAKLKGLTDYGLVTSRGCPRRCVFCSRVHGGKVIAMRPAEIIAVMQRIVDNTSIRTIGLSDDDFLLGGFYSDGASFEGRDRVIEFCRLYEKSGLPEKIGKLRNFEASIASFYSNGKVDKEMITWLQKTFDMVSIGTDGFCNVELERLKKGYVWEMVEPVVRALDEAGLTNEHFNILVNLRTEAQDLAESLINILNIRKFGWCRVASGADTPMVSPYPGSEYMADLKKRRLTRRIIWKYLGRNKDIRFIEPEGVIPFDPIVRDVILGDGAMVRRGDKYFMDENIIYSRMFSFKELLERLRDRIETELARPRLNKHRRATLENVHGAINGYLSGRLSAKAAVRRIRNRNGCNLKVVYENI